MDAIIGWVSSLAALTLVAGAIFVLLRACPDVLENWKAKWALIAGGGVVGLVLLASVFSNLFGSGTATQPSAESRAWVRIKSMPTTAEIRASLTHSANRYARSVQTPNDTSPNRWIGCDLWRNSINHRSTRNDGSAEDSVELRWLGTCRQGMVHGTGTLVFWLKDIDRPAQKLEVARVQLAVTKGVMANERDYREAWAQAIVTRTQRHYDHDVRSLLAGQRLYAFYLLVSCLTIGVGICLSYAAAAGRWNNANFVQISDWWGLPTLFAIGFTQMWHFMFSGAAVPPAWIAADEAPLLKLITGVAARARPSARRFRRLKRRSTLRPQAPTPSSTRQPTRC